VRAPVGPCTSKEPLGSARGDPRPAGRGDRRAGDWCSDSGGLWAAGRLVGDGGAAGEHQDIRVNSMVAAAWAVMAHGLLATHTHRRPRRPRHRWPRATTVRRGQGGACQGRRETVRPLELMARANEVRSSEECSCHGARAAR
jgi:hypothetical protein